MWRQSEILLDRLKILEVKQSDRQQVKVISSADNVRCITVYTFLYKNKVYKNSKAEICLKNRNTLKTFESEKFKNKKMKIKMI